VLLVVGCGTVFLGTLYPLLIDALNAGKISVGPPYFNTVFAPLMVPVLFLMGIAPFARWKEASLADLARVLRWAFVAAVLVGVLVPFIYGTWHTAVAVGILVAAWIVITAAINFVQRVQATRGGQSFVAAVFKQPRSFWGMHLAHIGVAVFVIGVTLVKNYEVEKDVKMEPGDSVHLVGYEFRFVGVHQVEGPNYLALRGEVELLKDGKLDKMLHPEKRNYASSAMPMTEAAIDAGLTRDVYVSLGEPIDKSQPEGAWAVRVYYKPFVDWIWGGCLLMSLGGLIAIADRRYRVKARAAAPAAASSAAA